MNQKTIYALGFFDGVHLGHQALLKACRELAAAHNCRAGVVTFTVHPDGPVSGNAPLLLNTNDDKAQLLTAYGMDCVVQLPFDETLKTTHWSSFLTQLVQSGAAGFVCGSDFRFGAGAVGTAKKLAAYCEDREMPFSIVPQQLLDSIRVSSTHIRELIKAGDIQTANRFLGHPHILSGQVLPGKQLGRTIGFPTANLHLPAYLLPPRFGVYACKATVDGNVYTAVTNVGTRPTVNGDGVTAEAHLLDFQGDLYGKTLTLAFYAFLRPEKKFDSITQLQEEILKNTAETRNFFEKSE
jgi:riboflavin kinase/FMN adenylyltransferase